MMTQQLVEQLAFFIALRPTRSIRAVSLPGR
jgi:hypothetical protein